ncbi:unnamed protein product [Plasmodium sp. DRC-Itaito]|nr:unnamed protein product [Plasmodium sp. DRC-Itaito]
MKGNSGDEKYIGDITSSDITSSESEYEEIDRYVQHSRPKYKTLIAVILEPSKRDIESRNIQSDNTPSNKFTDNQWNQLKHDFISNMLQNTEPNNYRSGNTPINIHTTTLHHSMDEKPFIRSIQDGNLYTGEEYNYDIINTKSVDIPVSVENVSCSDKNGSYSDHHHPYSGIDLINDTLSGNYIDIYDKILKRKENELFGTENTKHMSIHNVAEFSRDDPLLNQINLFHKWLDRHRNMCEKWENNHERLDKLKEEWNKDTNSGKLSDIPSSNKALNTDVSIQIDMDNPKPTTMVDTNLYTSTMDNILHYLDKKFHEPLFYDIYDDDVYYDVNDNNISTVNPDHNIDVPSKVQIEMNVKNGEIVKEKYPISDIWGI